MARMIRRVAVRLVVVAAGIGAGVHLVGLMRRSAGMFATSGAADWLIVVAGWSLIGCGVLAAHVRRPIGALLCAAGFAWFAARWNDASAGNAVVFTAGLVLWAVYPVLVAHAALRTATSRLAVVDRVALASAYVGAVVVAGLLPAALVDPRDGSCGQCPADVVAVTSHPGAAAAAGRVAVYAGAAWSAVLILVIARRLAGSSRARRWTAAWVCGPAVVLLLAVAVDFVHSIPRGFLSDDRFDRALLSVQGAGLIVLSLGAMWPLLRRRRARSTMARLVVEVANTPPPGGLAEALGRVLGDPGLRILYPLSDGRLVDGAGRDSAAVPGQEVTRLVRRDEIVALLAHRPGLVDVHGVADEIAQSARLVLDHERLQAEVRARLADLVASRARIVDVADGERRRLERDLHDGAQQKLVTFGLALRLHALRAGDGDPAAVDRLERALAEVSAAGADLRHLARGLYPRELADEGLAAGLRTLAESGPHSLRLRAVPDRRFAARVESAAYFVVAFAAAHGPAMADVTHDAGRLRVEVETATALADVTRLRDRVGAFDGSLEFEDGSGPGIRIRVELPCGS